MRDSIDQQSPIIVCVACFQSELSLTLDTFSHMERKIYDRETEGQLKVVILRSDRVDWGMFSYMSIYHKSRRPKQKNQGGWIDSDHYKLVQVRILQY